LTEGFEGVGRGFREVCPSQPSGNPQATLR